MTGGQVETGPVGFKKRKPPGRMPGGGRVHEFPEGFS
jgi:hypothetical protein